MEKSGAKCITLSIQTRLCSTVKLMGEKAFKAADLQSANALLLMFIFEAEMLIVKHENVRQTQHTYIYR